MKLLSITGNTKVRKTNKSSDYLMASLSLYPDEIICPWSGVADCMGPCLKSSGLASVYKSVNLARKKKTELYHNDKKEFYQLIAKDLEALMRKCEREGKLPAARLNTISDIVWEKTPIIEAFPDVKFIDYTKNASRLGKTPDNYSLIFSYSGAKKYAPSVKKAFKFNNPIAVVFSGDFPASFMGRDVVDGDRSDLVNARSLGRIVGLKAKGDAKRNPGQFVVDSDLIGASYA